MFRTQPETRFAELNLSERRPRAAGPQPREAGGRRTIVIRQSGLWQSLALLCLCLVVLAAVLMGQDAFRRMDAQHKQSAAAMIAVERKVQELQSGLSMDARRRYLLLGMRDHILRVNSRVSVGDAYRYAQLALDASEKYPSVDPLLLLAIGTVESGYDARATSRADARGLYQIWPATGRLLARSLGWDYDETTLYDPEKNTQAAALYLDILFSAYNDPQLVLAEYNGGPLNAGFMRAGVGQLAAETRSYVPRVVELHKRLRDQFETGMQIQAELMYRDLGREGKALGVAPTGTAAAALPKPPAPAAAPDTTSSRAPEKRPAR
jgi:hypothetical protein